MKATCEGQNRKKALKTAEGVEKGNRRERVQSKGEVQQQAVFTQDKEPNRTNEKQMIRRAHTLNFLYPIFSFFKKLSLFLILNFLFGSLEFFWKAVNRYTIARWHLHFNKRQQKEQAHK